MKTKNLVYRKRYMKFLRDWKDDDVIKIITGVRRCGKSTLMKMFAAELLETVSPECVQFYNFEDPEIKAMGDYLTIYRHINSKLIENKGNYIFIDEPQNVDEFERLLDGLYIKDNVDLYVTGSNGKLLSGEWATLLTGRYIECHILPFDFNEYIEATDSEKSTTFESFRYYSFAGGFPYATLLENSTSGKAAGFVKGVVDTIVEKDIYQRHEIEYPEAFQKIIDFLLDSIGSPVSPNSIAGALANDGTFIDSRTVNRYLGYLTETFLFYKANRYEIKGKRLLQTLNKYYTVDAGIRRMRLARKVDDDRGHLLENAVYLELRRRYREVFVGKAREKEIDFVAIKSDADPVYYQVAYSITSEETFDREMSALSSIKDFHPKILLTMDAYPERTYNGIRVIYAKDWFLNAGDYD